MENFTTTIMDQIMTHVVISYMIVFMFLSYVAKTYFEAVLERITKQNWKTVYSVLILGIFVAIPYAIFTQEGWMKLLCSYAIGTSLHELFFRLIEKKVKDE